jgi:hypothetical protein
LIGGNWIKVGQDIDGEADNDSFGHSVSMSSDGNRVAIGAPYNAGNGQFARHVQVYDLIGGNWIKVGQDIDGEADHDRFGYSVSMSSGGNRVAIGAFNNTGNALHAGHVRVYDLIGGNWIKVGQDVDGEADYDGFGYSVSMSSDGNCVAIGAPYNAGNGQDAGHVRLYSIPIHKSSPSQSINPSSFPSDAPSRSMNPSFPIILPSLTLEPLSTPSDSPSLSPSTVTTFHLPLAPQTLTLSGNTTVEAFLAGYTMIMNSVLSTSFLAQNITTYCCVTFEGIGSTVSRRRLAATSIDVRGSITFFDGDASDISKVSSKLYVETLESPKFEVELANSILLTTGQLLVIEAIEATPTFSPSNSPSDAPVPPTTLMPNSTTSHSPTPLPTRSPTPGPVLRRTSKPTLRPTRAPSLSNKPSILPSLQPSLSNVPSRFPTQLPSIDSSCEDINGIKFIEPFNTLTVDCLWLQNNVKKNQTIFDTICQPTERAYYICEETCKTCNDGCSDNATFIFFYRDTRNRDKAVTCDQISTSQRLINQFCEYISVTENCQETCNTCPSPTQSPSHTPSQQVLTTSPVLSPTIGSPPTSLSPSNSQIPSADSNCDDLVGVSFFVEGAGNKTCEWLAARKRVQRQVCNSSHAAYHICEETCGKCSDKCFDDSSGTFPDLYKTGVTRNCAWLSDRIASDGNKYCEKGRPAREICLETCGVCDGI